MKSEHIELEALKIEGRNAVLEAFRSGKPIDKLFVLDGCMDGPVRTILREAKKHDTVVNYVERERLDQLSETKKHQGVIAMAAAYEYATVEEILAKAEEKGEPPFVILLDGCDHPYREFSGGTWSHHPKTTCRGTDCDRSKDFCRSTQLYTGCKGDKFKADDGRVKGKRHLVCRCRYGWRNHV